MFAGPYYIYISVYRKYSMAFIEFEKSGFSIAFGNLKSRKKANVYSIVFWSQSFIMSSENSWTLIPSNMQPPTFNIEKPCSNLSSSLENKDSDYLRTNSIETQLMQELKPLEINLYNFFDGKTNKDEFEKGILKDCEANSKSLVALTLIGAAGTWFSSVLKQKLRYNSY